MIDFALLQSHGAILAIGYNAFERAWHISITGAGPVTIEVADTDPEAAVQTAMEKLAEQAPVAKSAFGST